jgi:gamma-aminobutyric acid type B receptor
VTIRPIDVLLPFAILTVLNLVILITWTITAPLRWERIMVEEDMFGQPIASKGTCTLAVSNRESTEMTFLCLLVAVNVTALFLSNYQSYRARKLPSEFNETFYLAITNLVILEGMVLGAPILFIVEDDPASFIVIRSLLVSIICLAVLVPMFVPKFNGAMGGKKAKRYVANASFKDRSVSQQPTSRGGNLGGIRTATTRAVTTDVGSIADTS